MKKAVLLMIALLVLTACGGNTPANDTQANKLNVVATIGMIADGVRNVGGEHVVVTQLMGAGVDPHLYQPSERDAQALINADVVFYGGLHLESQMGEILEARGGIGVGDHIPEEKLLTSTQYNAHDPHIWMDVELWTIVVGVIRDTLVEKDPANAEAYRQNAEAYITELNELDVYVQEQINRVPQTQRVLVTAHDAFQYFSAAYGIEVHAPQGISTESEAGVEDIRRTIDVIVSRQIPAIFVESSVPPDVVEAIQSGARDQGQEVTIGGSLYSDAMGGEGSGADTYIGMIRHNVNTIVAALLGQAVVEN